MVTEVTYYLLLSVTLTAASSPPGRPNQSVCNGYERQDAGAIWEDPSPIIMSLTTVLLHSNDTLAVLCCRTGFQDFKLVQTFLITLRLALYVPGGRAQFHFNSSPTR